MLVQPAPGLKVRDPHNLGRHVVAGDDVDASDLHWHRLIVTGDLVAYAPPAAAVEPPHAAGDNDPPALAAEGDQAAADAVLSDHDAADQGDAAHQEG